MLLGGEINFLACSLRHDSVLIFNFSDMKRGCNIKNLRISSHAFGKNLRNQRTLIYQKNSYRIKAQKLPMIKQGVKTMNAEFIRTRALSQLSFVQVRPYATRSRCFSP